MPNPLELFNFARHRVAYNELMNHPISDAITELQDEFPSINLHGFTETKLQNNYPVTQLTISNSNRVGAVFVVFDSSYAKYGIGRESQNIIIGLISANTCEEAKEAIKIKFRELLSTW